MKTVFIVIVLLIVTSCAITPRDQKRKDILQCVHNLHQEDVHPDEAFEICRQVYGMEKIQ